MRILFAVLLALGFLALRPAAAMEIQRVVSPGGIEAWLVEDHRNPMIAIEIGFRGGAALDPTGKEGLATLVSGLLDEGAGDMASADFQSQLSTLGIDLSFDAGLDDFSGSMRTLSATKAEAFELLRLALSEPRFDAEPIARIRGQLQALLAQDAEDPDRIAGRAFSETVMAGHPYARDPMGDAASLAAIERADLVAWVERRLARDNLVIGVVGDMSAAELAPLLDQIFGALPAAAAPWALPALTLAGDGGIAVIDREIPQSVIVAGLPGITRDHPDFYAAQLLMELLGGGFGSRLTEEVRVKRGLAYSIGANLATLEAGGLVTISTGTQNARAAETLEIVRAVLADLAAHGPGATELEDARAYTIGNYPLRFTTSPGIARALVAIQIEELGIDYIDRRAELYRAVTRADVTRIAGELLDPAAMTVLIVGRPDGIDSTD